MNGNVFSLGGSVGQGMALGEKMQGMRKQNALADLYKQHGAGMMRGEQNALAALAGVDPMAATKMGMAHSGERRAQEAHGIGMQFDRARLDALREQGKREAQKHMANMTAIELQREADENAAMLTQGAAAYRSGDAQFSAFVQANAQKFRDNGINPGLLDRENFIALAAGMKGAQDAIEAGLSMADAANPQPKEPSSIEALRIRASEAGLQPGTREYQQFMASGGKQPDSVSVSVNTAQQNPMPGLSKLGEGMTYLYDTSGNVRIDEQGRPMSVPIPGTDRAEKREATGRKLRLAMQDYERKFSIVESSIDKAIRSLGANGRRVAGWGSLLSGLPESEARDFQAVLDTVKANLGFEELQAMRDTSPTGGALGQVTEREIAFLQAVQGNLDTAQSPAQLMEILQEIKARRAEFRQERISIIGGGAESAQPAKVAPPAEINFDFQNDQQRQIWDRYRSQPEQ